MSYANNKITAPVSIYDVQRALGVSLTDLGALCQSANINIWSRHKPCEFDSLWEYVLPDIGLSPAPQHSSVVMADQSKVSYGTVATWGIIFPTMRKVEDFKTNPPSGEHEVVKYKHDYPSGRVVVSGVTYNYAYRLTDFNGYSHNQAKPLGNISVAWSGRNFTVTIPLNWDSVNGILPTEFDGAIYQYIAWKPMIMIVTTSNVVERKVFGELFLYQLNSTMNSITITGSVTNQNTNYIFVPMLVAYKYMQEEGAGGVITNVYNPIIPSAQEPSERCGIPMPCDRITSTSQVDLPYIVVENPIYDGTTPPVDDPAAIVATTGSYYIHYIVKFYAGGANCTFSNISFMITIGGVDTGYRYSGTLSANQDGYIQRTIYFGRSVNPSGASCTAKASADATQQGGAEYSLSQQKTATL